MKTLPLPSEQAFRAAAMRVAGETMKAIAQKTNVPTQWIVGWFNTHQGKFFLEKVKRLNVERNMEQKVNAAVRSAKMESASMYAGKIRELESRVDDLNRQYRELLSEAWGLMDTIKTLKESWG